MTTVDGGYLDNLLGPMEAQDDGTPLAKTAAWNFKDGVLATLNAPNDTIDITAPLASGGSGGTVPALGVANTVLVTDGALMSWDFIVDANVDALAAIAGTKIDPDFGAQNIETTGWLGLGAAPATTGDVRLDDTGSVYGWALTGGVNVPMLAKTAADDVYVGLGNAAGTNPPNVRYGANSKHIHYANGVFVSSVNASAFELNIPSLAFTTATVTPGIIQTPDPTDAIVADRLLIKAQTASHGVNGTGGGLDLAPGDGPTAGGVLALKDGALNDVLTIDDAQIVNLPFGALTLDLAGAYARLGLVAGSGAGSASSVGTVQLQKDFIYSYRDFAEAANVTAMVSPAGDDFLWFGGLLGGARPGQVIFNPTSQITFKIVSTDVARVSSTDFRVLGTDIRFHPASVAPSFNHQDDSASGVTADDLAVRAQGVTAGAGTAQAGSLLLQGGIASGSATNKHGNVAFGLAPGGGLPWNTAEVILFNADVDTIPTGSPVGGGYLWTASGLLTCMDTSGNVDDIGPVLNGYDEAAGQTTTAAALEDIPGCTFNITTTSTGAITAMMSVECSASGVATGGWAIEINGVDGTVIGRSMTTTAIGAVSCQAKSASLAPGTYAVTGRHYRVAGVATVNTDNAQLAAIFVAA